jgi:hypothetical protein
MILLRLLAAVGLAGFLALSGRAIAAYGYLGFFEMAGATDTTRLLLVDLTVGLILAAVWIVADARGRGTRAWPYLTLAALLGSAGPLAYLVLRGRRRNP